MKDLEPIKENKKNSSFSSGVTTTKKGNMRRPREHTLSKCK